MGNHEKNLKSAKKWGKKVVIFFLIFFLALIPFQVNSKIWKFGEKTVY